MENLRREGSPACRRMDVLSTEHLALPQVSSQPCSPYISQRRVELGKWEKLLPTVTFALALRALAARQGGPRLLGAAAGACPP